MPELPHVFDVAHVVDPGEWLVGEVTYWDGTLGALTQTGDQRDSIAVRAPAFVGLPTPAVGTKYFYSPAPDGALVRPYAPYLGPGKGGDDATFHLGVLTSWYPLGKGVSVVTGQNDVARLEPGDYYIAHYAGEPFGSTAFGHLVRDGDSRPSAVVLAAEFSHLFGALTPVFWRAQEAYGEPLVDAAYSEAYGGLPAAMVGHRFFYQPFDDGRGPTRAGNLRPVDPTTAGPRG